MRDNNIVENERRISGGFFHFPSKHNFLSLFTSIWIKNHFPVKSPVSDFFKCLFSSPEDILISLITENKAESSADNLTLDDKLSDKSLI